MQDLKSILKDKKVNKGKGYIKHEFQDFGYRLALALSDVNHKALYIKLAKTEDRNLLKKALNFALDYPNAKSRGRIFMWKLKELKELKEKD